VTLVENIAFVKLCLQLVDLMYYVYKKLKSMVLVENGLVCEMVKLKNDCVGP
jgi:hypothetical protein